jgi:cell division septum initiation protein DivIVA
MKTDTNLKSEEIPSVFNGYKVRIAALLSQELQRLKEDTERESVRILADAKQQAQDIIDQAELHSKQKAKYKIELDIENLLAEVEEKVKKAVAMAKENALQELKNNT